MALIVWVSYSNKEAGYFGNNELFRLVNQIFTCFCQRLISIPRGIGTGLVFSFIFILELCVAPNCRVLSARSLHLTFRFNFVFQDGWTTDDLQYLWKKLDPVQIVPDLHLPRFTLEKYVSDYCNIKTNTGKSVIKSDWVLT